MKVYIVSRGYDYEDSMAIKVFLTEEKAVEWILNVPPKLEEIDDGTIITYKVVEMPSKYDRFFSNYNGEYYTLKEYEVEQ